MFIATILSVASYADITDGKFTTAQIWDVQYSWSGTTLNASGFNNLYASVNYANQTNSAARLTDAQIADAGSNGRYFAFFNSTTNPGTYGLGLYNSDGTLYKVINNTGTFSALGNGAIFYLGNGSWGTVITPEAGYSKGQSGTFTGMNRSVSSADLTGYAYTNTIPLTAGQTASSVNSGPTVTGTSTTNTVTTSTTNGTPTSTSVTTNGTPVTTVTSTAGTQFAVISTALNRGAQTTKTLAVDNIQTTQTYNPTVATTTITTPTTVTTTTTTPTTVTTTTTPVTTTTYSDNTTTTTNGTPVVTTAAGTSIVTTTTSAGTPIVTSSSVTTNGDPTITTQTLQTWTTRIDGMDRLKQTSNWTNQAMTGSVVERFTVDEKGIRQRIGAWGDEKQGWMYVIGEGQFNKAQDGYKHNGSLVGLGYDRRISADLLIGGSYAQASGSLSGSQAGGDYDKQVTTFYSLYAIDGWMLNTTLGHSENKFTNYHGIQDLNIMNMGSTSGKDNWLHNRLYTPAFNDIKLLVGVRTDRTRLNGFTENGSGLTAMSYDNINQTRTTNEYGFRWDKQWEQVVFGVEYAMNSDKLQTSTVTVGFTPSTNVLGSIGFRNQRQNGIENNVGFTSLTWRF